ncbi:hypothetical protein BDZ97DRAFT_1759790 [Flammula alnicola]|nr:hypothetical protein BDZ97DRAFT_1759790 [Flammula alnicola]
MADQRPQPKKAPHARPHASSTQGGITREATARRTSIRQSAKKVRVGENSDAVWLVQGVVEHLFPDSGKVEAELAVFLNSIGTAIHKIFKKEFKCKRTFQATTLGQQHDTKPLSGGLSAVRKPDLNLTEEGETLFMDDRQGRTSIPYRNLFLSNRVVGSVKFDLEKEPKMLMRLTELTLSDPSAIGFDPTIRHGPGGKRFVTVADKEYEIIKPLFISDTIRGRGTVCWHARFDGADYVIKNTWADVSRGLTEPEIMKMTDNVERIAYMVAEYIVQVDGSDDTTAYVYPGSDRRQELSRRRLETKPNPTDERDSEASSIKPQIADAGVNSQMRRGILIDLDDALLVREDGLGRDTATVGHRTEQKPRHDMESFFYVLLWICWHYSGPNNAERQNFDIMQTDIETWIAGKIFVKVGRSKRIYMRSDEGIFDDSVLTMRRKKMFMKKNAEIKHQHTINILEETCKVLPDTENWTPDHDKEGYGLTGSKKRKLESYEPPLEPLKEEAEEAPPDHPAKCVKSAPDPEKPRPSRSRKLAAASASTHCMTT